MDDARIKGAVEALKALKRAVTEDSGSDWSTRALNGWVEKLGNALDEDLSHLAFEDDAVTGCELLTSIDMAIAYGEQFLGKA